MEGGEVMRGKRYGTEHVILLLVLTLFNTNSSGVVIDRGEKKDGQKLPSRLSSVIDPCATGPRIHREQLSSRIPQRVSTLFSLSAPRLTLHSKKRKTPQDYSHYHILCYSPSYSSYSYLSTNHIDLCICAIALAMLLALLKTF